MMSNLQDFYQQQVAKKLIAEFGLKNVYSCPKIEKVIVNCGLGEAVSNPKILEEVSDYIAKICGQRPVKTYARRSIAGFKLRRGQPIGLKVTLRGARMYNFLEKLFKLTLPRLRDFRGLSLANFDKWGNYTLGLKEIFVFPETATVPAEKAKGLEITIVTNSKDPAKSQRLLELLGMPFQKQG